MAEQTNQDELIDPTHAENEHLAQAPGSFGAPDERGIRQGGINQGTDADGLANLTPEQAAEYRRRQMIGDLTDDNAASHQGGIGAQSGQTDFGSAGNLSGGVAEQTR